MYAKILVAALVFVDPCTGSPSPSTPPPPEPTVNTSLPICPDDLYEDDVAVHSLRMIGDDVETYVTWTGCAEDVLTLCWSGEYDPDKLPLTTDLFVDYTFSADYCTEERGRTLRAHAYPLRLDAFHDGHDQIDFWLHDKRVSYAW